jgi:hypothetical protein
VSLSLQFSILVLLCADRSKCWSESLNCEIKDHLMLSLCNHRVRSMLFKANLDSHLDVVISRFTVSSACPLTKSARKQQLYKCTVTLSQPHRHASSNVAADVQEG